jgi:hypothetical protein
MAETESLQAQVRWSASLLGSRPGMLVLANDCLTLSSDDREVFSLPSTEWHKLEWPRFGLSATLKVNAPGQRYTLTFVPRGGSLATWEFALHQGAEWRRRLHPEYRPHHARAILISCFLVLMKFVGLLVGLLLGLELAVDPRAAWFERGFGWLIMIWMVMNAVMWWNARGS